MSKEAKVTKLEEVAETKAITGDEGIPLRFVDFIVDVKLEGLAGFGLGGHCAQVDIQSSRFQKVSLSLHLKEGFVRAGAVEVPLSNVRSWRRA